jgi:hypothetical protein
MNRTRFRSGATAFAAALFCLQLVALPAPDKPEDDPRIPEVLKPWRDWVTWADKDRSAPSLYSKADERVALWPSQLKLDVQKTGGRFDLNVTIFAESWLQLPGNAEHWPLNVTSNNAAVPVVEHGGGPSIRLVPGAYRVTGEFRWADLPQNIFLPPNIGIISLAIDGAPVENPRWDSAGFVWFRRDASTDQAEKPFLNAKLYALLEDGIPLTLRTQVELTVAGKSREEDLGTVIPEGWKVSSVASKIPVIVDDAGRMKAQVRAGNWTVEVTAFRFDNPKELKYAADAKRLVDEQLLAFAAKPEMRTAEIEGAQSIDASQTTIPDTFRAYPVYRWMTSDPLQLVERMRGMGDQKIPGLTIKRSWWLDEDGRGFTFRDRLKGEMQQIWRLDAAPGQAIGAVRSAGQGQLITANPTTNAAGVEIRTRAIDLEATGRMDRTGNLSATGWIADADAVTVAIELPPGWRLFALFGADWVRGDWLTQWTLLDMFLLLIFTLAVFRMFGLPAAALAFVAFGLSYHEILAPRYIWLAVLVPLALLRVIPEGRARALMTWLKWGVLGVFVLIGARFAITQVQQALYPQLEPVYRTYGMAAQRVEEDISLAPAAPAAEAETTLGVASSVTARYAQKSAPAKQRGWAINAAENLQYDSNAKIQTGPAVPTWNWRQVSFGWNGPVQASQQVRPVLIPSWLARILSFVRVLLMFALAAVLLRWRPRPPALPRSAPAAAAALLVITAFLALPAHAQVPDQPTLNQLRERLLEKSDSFPTAADIPVASLKVADQRVTIEAEVHAAARTAVPIPGRLDALSPISVSVDGKPEPSIRRQDGFLWVALEPGVHKVRAEALLPNGNDWVWAFMLKPRQVTVDAPAWTVTGISPNGVPEAQVFLTLTQKSAPGEATYDSQNLQTLVRVDRALELGLRWQIRTTVVRVTPATKAVSLRVPLLPGESVLSSDVIVRDGAVEVRLGAQQESTGWESRLEITNKLTLTTRPEDSWIESWRLVVSPIWSVALTGLPPIFQASQQALEPTWNPWPGESVELTVSRPKAVSGATMTIGKVEHATSLGKRQLTSHLELALQCSLGEDFLIDLPPDAEITSLTLAGKQLPIRKDGSRLILPVRPGDQQIAVDWKSNDPLGFASKTQAVSFPVESANVSTTITVPEDRWILWAAGPLRGPAVRFWGILLCSLLAALILGRVQHSPLRTAEWMLLVIGLTQVPLPAALIVVGWLFLLAWRGRDSFQNLTRRPFNLAQFFLVGVTAVAVGVLIWSVGEGLLGSPEMFITGNGSTRTVLSWYKDRSAGALPQPSVFSVSIWWYRLLMLIWALWLAAALIRWLNWGWGNFSRGGFIRRKPPLPPRPAPATVQP